MYKSDNVVLKELPILGGSFFVLCGALSEVLSSLAKLVVQF